MPRTDRLCNAQRYERSGARRDTRAGHYQRGLQTKAGEVRLRVPKLRQQTFETAIIERYRRRESSVEEALIEMYLAGVSVRRVEDITEALWGTRVSPSTVSDLNKKIYGTIEAWRNRPIEGNHPYVYLDGIVLKRSWAGEVRNVSLLVAIGVNESGYREILGICEGAKVPVTGIIVFPADDHFALGFKTVGRTLRVRLSSDVLADLGQVLLDLARERRAAAFDSRRVRSAY